MRRAGATREVHIGEVLLHAAVFGREGRGGRGEPGERRMAVEETLTQTVARLFATLDARGIDYLLVGGVALLQYVEGRNTEDLDLIFALSALPSVPEIRIESREGYFARGDIDGLQVDLLLTGNPLFDEVRRRHRTIRPFVEREIPCATVEGLLLLKLYALPSLYREGNFARVGLYENDVATLLYAYKPAIEPLLAELARHLGATDLEAVRAVVADLERRIERFEGRS
jgi:hypothetical protein